MRKYTGQAILLSLVFSLAWSVNAGAEIVRGGALLGSVSPVVKISRESNSLKNIEEGETLYVFSEKGDPVVRIKVKNVYSDQIYSEPLSMDVVNRIRETGAILIFSNLPEYGAMIKVTLAGSEEAFRKFVSDNPESELRPEAERIADGIVFRPYKLRGTAEAFEEFMRKHPDNYYFQRALERRDYVIFITYKSADKLSGYREFISRYPDNLHVSDAKARMRELLSQFEEVSVEHLAVDARNLVGKKVKFYAYLHSVLPIYLEGTSVGKKTAGFESPRNSVDYVNFQVESNDYVLWRLFTPRENAELSKKIQLARKGAILTIYGQVFSAEGNAPWIDVTDFEFRE